MNEYNLEIQRKRHQNLLIVEGNHEKNKLFKLIFQTFPEIDISLEDIVIYGTNIYILYNEIVEEYGEKWYNEEVDLPFIVGKKKNYKVNKNDFINIFLIFDYEHHDPNFSEQKIENMQRYFRDSTDMGKLYLNYPMIESYQHLTCFTDADYDELTVKVSLQPGFQYKNLVKDTFVAKLINLPKKLEEILSDRFGIEDIEACKKCTRKLLEISKTINLLENINHVLIEVLSEKDINTAKYQINSLMLNGGYIQNNKNYYEYMREVFKQIVLHNISKGSKIQNINSNVNKSLFELLDSNKILNLQNNVSRDTVTGYIWVLNTCVFIIPDYNFKLIE